MFFWFKKNLATCLVVFVSLLVVLLLSLYIFSLKNNLQEKEAQISALKIINQPHDPFIDYALNLKKYDPKGARSVPFNCFERKPSENMSQKNQFWYNTANHDPVIPENDKRINMIQESLGEKNTEANKICYKPSGRDYLVDYRYQYEKGKYKNIAELFRFKENIGGFSYDVYPVSDAFNIIKVVSWLDNGDLIYDPIDTSGYHTVYVFTSDNNDILLESCQIKMGSNMKANFTCKNFNNITNSSTYLPNSFLDDYIGSVTF